MVTWGARDGTEMNGEHSSPTTVAQTPGISGAICWLNLLLIYSLASRHFSPGTPVLPSLQTNTSKLHFNLEHKYTFK